MCRWWEDLKRAAERAGQSHQDLLQQQGLCLCCAEERRHSQSLGRCTLYAGTMLEADMGQTRCCGAGGGRISSKLQSKLVNVTKIYSTSYAFAALRSDGTVRAWGDASSMLARLIVALHGMHNDSQMGQEGCGACGSSAGAVLRWHRLVSGGRDG